MLNILTTSGGDKLEKKKKQFDSKQYRILEYNCDTKRYLVIYKDNKDIKIAFINDFYYARYGPDVIVKMDITNGYLWTQSKKIYHWLVFNRDLSNDIMIYLDDINLWDSLKILTVDMLKGFEY